MSFDKRAYDTEFHKQAYDRMSFVVPKGKRETIKSCAVKHGISVNRLIVDALETLYHIDLSKKE